MQACLAQLDSLLRSNHMLLAECRNQGPAAEAVTTFVSVRSHISSCLQHSFVISVGAVDYCQKVLVSSSGLHVAYVMRTHVACRTSPT
jgi:hypothetical protein